MSKLNLETPPSSLSLEMKPEYILLGIFIHGAYNRKTCPFRVNPHASRSLQRYRSEPTLMTFTNSTPGNVVLGNADGSDNTKITNYFKTNSNFDLIVDTNQNAIAENFLNYSKNGLATLSTNPRVDLDDCSKAKTIAENYVPRNCFIDNNKVGISHTFINKIFSTNDPPTERDSWGIFIFNNSFDIEAGTRIEEILPDIQQDPIINEEGDDIGVEFNLHDIIRKLTSTYHLTDKDYLFLFDFSCSIFCKDINLTGNKRLIRDWSKQVSEAYGFPKKGGKKCGKKSGKKCKKGGKKRTRKLKKKNGIC